MDVLSDLYQNYREDPTWYFNFSKNNDCHDDIVLIKGLPHWWSLGRRVESELEGKKLVYLNLEEPNGYFAPGFDWMRTGIEIHKVLTLCPYTAEWQNEKSNVTRWEPVYFPFNADYIPEVSDKPIDVIYSGKTASHEILSMIKSISRFNYAFVSFEENEFVSHHDVTYLEKLDLYAKSKVTLVHNLLYPAPNHIEYLIKEYPDFHKCHAFSQIKSRSPISFIGRATSWRMHKRPLVPQLKSRLFEAAFCKSLILCRKDPWNLVERFFTPGEDFLYFEVGKLKATLERVLNSYDQYVPMINSAYEKALKNYTTEHFCNQYLKTI